MTDSLAYALRDPRAREWDPPRTRSSSGVSGWHRRTWSLSAAGRAVRDVARGAEHSGRDPNQYGNADARFANRGKSILPLLINDAEEGRSMVRTWNTEARNSGFQTDCARLRGEESRHTRGKYAPDTWATDSLAYALKDPRARDWGPSSYSVAGRYFWLGHRAWSVRAAGRAVRDVVRVVRVLGEGHKPVW